MSEVTADQGTTEPGATPAPSAEPPADATPPSDAAQPTDAGTAPADVGGETSTPGDGVASAGAPETYDWTGLEMPDGMEVDTALAEKAEPIFRELGLNQEQANSIANVVTQHLLTQHTEAVAAENDRLASESAGWIEAMKADQEIGGSGGEDYAANVTRAREVVEAFGTPEFAQWLDESRLGSHPEMVRLMLRVAHRLPVSEDNPGGGEPPPGEPPPMLKRMYADDQGNPKQ